MGRHRLKYTKTEVIQNSNIENNRKNTERKLVELCEEQVCKTKIALNDIV